MTEEPGTRARVVAMPGTMSGQPRIYGTRMTVAQLLEYVRGGMTTEEISTTWPNLPAGWWDAIIAWIDSQAAPDVDVEAVIAVLDSIPDVPPAPGDELPSEILSGEDIELLLLTAVEHPEELAAFGSGNIARNLGIPNPEAVTFKWRLAHILAVVMRDRRLDAAAVSALAGEIEPTQVERITRGQVRDVDSYAIMRLLKAIGYRIIIDVMAPKEGFEGVVWINESSGYRYDEKSIEVLRSMEPPKRQGPPD